MIPAIWGSPVYRGWWTSLQMSCGTRCDGFTCGRPIPRQCLGAILTTERSNDASQGHKTRIICHGKFEAAACALVLWQSLQETYKLIIGLQLAG